MECVGIRRLRVVMTACVRPSPTPASLGPLQAADEAQPVRNLDAIGRDSAPAGQYAGGPDTVMATDAGPGRFGLLLRQHRVAAGLSQEALAERAGLSRRGIADLERGQRRSPHLATVRRLAETLQLDPAQRAALFASAQAATAPPLATVPLADLGSDAQAHHNLPVQLTSLIGRVQEIADVRRELARTRLLTLAGPGGVGKTRLALAVAERELRTYSDGVWFVDLASLADPPLVPHQVATVLQVRECPGEELIQTLIRILQPRSLLLILDNCEQVLAACADLVYALLRNCPQVRLVTTSREVFGIGAETVWRVPPLRQPQAFAASTPEQVASGEAAALFVERARVVQPEFAVTYRNAAIVAEVCRRLDGIPLAIELAAARLKLLTLEQLAERLGDHVRLLATRDRTAPARQQTLHATIEWSYGLLSDLERCLFDRLSVFDGGWTLEGAESVGGSKDTDALTVLDLLERLVDKSLVLTDLGGANPPRYRLLETLRQYGRQQLDARGEAEAVRARHATYYIGLTEQAERGLHGPGQRLWLDRLDAEQSNLRAALAWALERDEVVSGLRLGAALWRFWGIRGHLAEGRRWLQALLAPAERAAAPVALRAAVLRGSGHLAFAQGSVEAAAACFELSCALCRKIDDQLGVAAALRDLGTIEQARGDYARATMLYEQSLEFYRRVGETAGVATCLDDLGEVARHRSEYETAMALGEEALALHRELGDAVGMAFSLNELANVARHRGDYPRGRAFATEALTLQRELGDIRGVGYSLNNLGIMAQASGEHEQAESLYREALSLFRMTGDRRGISVVLPGLSALAQNRAHLEEAQALAEEALRLHRVLGEDRAIAQRLDALGRLARLMGDTERAGSLHRESLALFARLGDRRGMAMALDGFASLAALQNEPIRAAALFGLTSALREAIHAAPDFGAYVDPAATDEAIAEIRDCLGEHAFARAWNNGRKQALEQAVAVLLSGQRVRPRTRAGTLSLRPPGDPLTRREREVVRLVVEGRTNREIGQVLLISPGTARTHVEHVLTKLGLRSRVEIAAWAVGQGLT